MAKIQRQGVKTDTEIVGAGGVISNLIGDDQIYVSADSINKTLKNAIIDGDIGAGDFSTISNWAVATQYAVTWTASQFTHQAYARRVGSNLEGMVQITVTGAIGAGDPIQITLSGLNIDESVMPDTPASKWACGYGTFADVGSANYLVTVSRTNSPTTLRVEYTDDNGTSVRLPDMTGSAPVVPAVGDEVSFWFSVPILGWDANPELNVIETDNIFPAKAIDASSSAIATGVETFLGFATAAFDNDLLFTNIGSGHNTVYTSTTYATVNKTGYYRVAAQVFTDDTDLDADETFNLKVWVDGSTVIDQARITMQASPAIVGQLISVDNIHYLTVGQKISISFFHNATGAVSLVGSTVLSSFSIHRIDRNPVTGLMNDIAIFKDIKVASAGGTATSGSWETRTLNNMTANSGFASLSANQITLQSGTYLIEGSAPAFAVGDHKARLRNITDSTTAIVGSSEFSSDASVYAQTRSELSGKFSISSTKVFEVQHRVQTTKGSNGYGESSTGFGEDDVYTILKITKLS